MYEVELLKRLVSLNTDSLRKSNYGEAARLVMDEAASLGMEAEIVGREVPNVVARLDAGAEMDLALVSHYDVVPARGPWRVSGMELDPFEPVEVDGRIYGRGAADDKSAVAASLAAVRELRGERLRYNPVVVVTGDEEVGGRGIEEVVEAGVPGDRVVVVDAAADYLSVGASGVVHGWVRVRGRGGHAGYPHRARNPVWSLARMVEGLERFSEFRAARLSDLPSPPGSPVGRLWGRFTVTVLRAGGKHNVIPDSAEAGFDMRLIPGEDPSKAIEELRSRVASLAACLGVEAEVEILEPINEGWRTDPDHPFVAEALAAMESATGRSAVAAELGGNDGYFFARMGIPTVAFGAIREENNIHAPGEFVYVEDVVMLKRFIKSLLRGRGGG